MMNIDEQVAIMKKECKESLKQLKSKKWYKQIPNILTASRGISPIVIIPLLFMGKVSTAIIANACFAVTDLLDGFIARTFNCGSEFGRKLDTICDKIFSITLMAPIAIMNPLICINILMEGVIAYINSNSIVKGNNPQTIYLGKFKNALLSFSIVAAYASAFINIPTNFIEAAFGSTLIFQVLAANKYNIIDKSKDREKIKNSKIINNNQQDIESEHEKQLSNIYDDMKIVEIENQDNYRIEIPKTDSNIENDHDEQEKNIYNNIFPLETESTGKVKTMSMRKN